jgi:hypothetical protein
LRLKLYIYLILLFPLIGESDIISTPSFQGFKGVGNTPNCEIYNEGEFEFLYSNQIDNLPYINKPESSKNKTQENYFLNMGVLPNMDISLRYSKGNTFIVGGYTLSDRMMNFKYKLSFIPADIIKIAFGIQDIGGGAPHLHSKYIVISKDFNAFRTNLGYAKGYNSGALNGVFGTVEYQPFSWLQIASEYDTNTYNSIIKSNFNVDKLSIGFIAKQSLNDKNIYTGIYANMIFDKIKADILNKKTFDIFKPIISFKPNFIIIDGSEYGNMDYSLALDVGFSIYITKNTILNSRYYIPISMSDNFQKGEIYEHLNRYKSDIVISQLLLSHFIHTDLTLPWITLVQVGRFDKELIGMSIESAISSSTYKNRLLFKTAYLQDNLYESMIPYQDKYRIPKILSYKYYLNDFNADIKFSTGEFLYGDKGIDIGLKRYYKNMSLQFDISRTKHKRTGVNNIVKFTFNLSFGNKIFLKNKFIDIKINDIEYSRSKTLVKKGKRSYTQQHHITEIKNEFTLDN